MEELGEARLQIRQLKKQVLRLQQQLALAEKQATKAMEAHLPKPGDSYDDSFEAVLREEMMMMKAGFELKIQLLTEEVRTACGHVDRDARRRPSNRIVPTRLTLACDRDACATVWRCIGLLACHSWCAIVLGACATRLTRAERGHRTNATQGDPRADAKVQRLQVVIVIGSLSTVCKAVERRPSSRPSTAFSPACVY